MMNNNNGITLEEALERLAKRANITADDMKFYIEDNVNEPYKSLYEYKAIKSALTELSAIKQRAEEKRNDGNTLLREIELIDYILEGEGK